MEVRRQSTAARFPVELRLKGTLVACRYNYDLNGNLHLLNPGNSGRLTPLRYDLRDRITRLGDVQYRLDEDGFLKQRGADIFEYNSKGQSVLINTAPSTHSRPNSLFLMAMFSTNTCVFTLSLIRPSSSCLQ